MSLGRVYVWTPDGRSACGGTLSCEVVELERLTEGLGALAGRHVRVRNGGRMNRTDGASGEIRPVTLGDARADVRGNFLFPPGRGGGRIEKVLVAPSDAQRRYVQAARFGEVNAYYHVDRIAAHVDELLRALGASPLPLVVVVVNAHHAAVDEADGTRDGLPGPQGRWHPFQGGHYRLPGRPGLLRERDAVSVDGEIHLGPGRKVVRQGALQGVLGASYRANASHNAGIIYHEYGHHLTRHTADFRANGLRPPHEQSNRKTALDEAIADYFAAAMLGTPHIWTFHHRHDETIAHRRSLLTPRTMDSFDRSPAADPHANGTVWAAAAWQMRTAMARRLDDGGRGADVLMLQALLLIGQRQASGPLAVASLCRRRSGFRAGLSALLEADVRLYGGVHRRAILQCFQERGIVPRTEDPAPMEARCP